MNAKEFTRKFAAYTVLFIGAIIVLAFLVAGVGSFIAFSDAIITKKIVLGVVFIVAAILCAVITYVVFDVLQEESKECDTSDWSRLKEEGRKKEDN